MLNIGSVVGGKYKILNKVGHGGMSVVYLAMNEAANKQWAIKEVRKDVAKDFDVIRQSLVAEIDMLKRLSHPNLPSIVDVIEDDDRFLIVMDYIEGNPLSVALEEYGALPQDEVIKWAMQLCDVLGYLHSMDPPIIYRDMKPSNIMLRPDGNITLIDFGTAREYKDKNIADTTWLGTMGYAAPEQFGGMGQTDARTDIYCLGTTLYHLITGKNPCEPPYEICPIRTINNSLSTGLEKIILKCTQSDPQNRYQNAEELMYALEHYNEIDDSFYLKQKRKLALFMTSAILTVACLGVSVWSFVEGKRQRNESYEYKLATANTIQDFRDTILIDPTRLDAYKKLNEFLVADSVITTSEGQELMLLKIGIDEKNSKGVIGQENVLQKLKNSNSEEYADLCYSYGQSFLFYYDADNERDRYSYAKAWFLECPNSNTMAKVYCDISDCLDMINQYQGAKIRQVDNMYDEYQVLWEKIKTLEGQTRGIDSADTKIQIWEEINSMVNSKILHFLEVTNKKDLISFLENISEQSGKIESSVLQGDIDNLQEEIRLTISRIETAN